MNNDTWLAEVRAEAERRRAWRPPPRRITLWEQLALRRLLDWVLWLALWASMAIIGTRCAVEVLA